MIWPFKKRKLTIVEYAATQPMPPCGRPEAHWRGKMESVWGCLACAGMEMQKQKETEERLMAEKIAAVALKKMKETP